MLEGQHVVFHIVIYGDLQDYFQSECKLPEKISDLARYKDTDTNPSFDTLEYRPEAWGEPGTILLQSETCGSTIITFSEGASVIVRKYYKPVGQ